MTRILNAAARFDLTYIAKRSKKRSEISAVALLPVSVPEGDAPEPILSLRPPEGGRMIWARSDAGLMHRHVPDDEFLATPAAENPLFVDIGTHKKTVNLDEFLFGVREVVEDGRVPAAAEAQRAASRCFIASDGLYAPTQGAYFRLEFTINRDRKMQPAVEFVPMDAGTAGTNLSGCFPLPLLERCKRLAAEMNWTVTAPDLLGSEVSEDEIDAMMVPALQHLCEELVGAGIPNRNSSNFSVGHLSAFLRYTDPDKAPDLDDLREIVAMIDGDAARGDYTNPTGEKVLLSTLRNRMMHHLLQDRNQPAASPSL